MQTVRAGPKAGESARGHGSWTEGQLFVVEPAGSLPGEEVLEPGAEKNLFGLCERNSWLLRFFDVFGVDSP